MKTNEESINVRMSRTDWKVVLLAVYTFHDISKTNGKMNDKLEEIEENLETHLDETFKYDER